MNQDTMKAVYAKPKDAKLTVQELACAMYEGLPHVQNLAEKTARSYGEAEALTFFGMMGDDVQNFWREIARQIINHSIHWQPGPRLDDIETKRLRELPRVPHT